MGFAVLAVVARDGKDLAENRFETVALAMLRIVLKLQKPRIRLRLNLGQIRQFEFARKLGQLADDSNGGTQ